MSESHTPRPHPHFDDRGTLDWHERLDEALTSARRQGKRVFIEFGRELCGNCRALVQGVVPHPEVAPLLRAGFVAVASDCDDPEDAVAALTEHMPDAMSLPFVIFTDADGRFLAGGEGAQSARSFKTLLERLPATGG